MQSGQGTYFSTAPYCDYDLKRFINIKVRYKNLDRFVAAVGTDTFVLYLYGT